MGRFRALQAEASRFALAVFGVLGAASLAVWVIDVITSKHHRPFTFWAVVTLALLLSAALLWGLRRGRPHSGLQEVSIAHVEHLHVGEQANLPETHPTTAPPLGAPRKVPKFARFEGQTIRLGDLVESGSPVLESVAFENCKLHGPVMLYVMGAFTLEGCHLPVGGTNAFWEIDPSLPRLVGAIGVKNCAIVDCDLINVGFAGGPELISHLKRQLGLPLAPAPS